MHDRCLAQTLHTVGASCMLTGLGVPSPAQIRRRSWAFAALLRVPSPLVPRLLACAEGRGDRRGCLCGPQAKVAGLPRAGCSPAPTGLGDHSLRT